MTIPDDDARKPVLEYWLNNGIGGGSRYDRSSMDHYVLANMGINTIKDISNLGREAVIRLRDLSLAARTRLCVCCNWSLPDDVNTLQQRWLDNGLGTRASWILAANGVLDAEMLESYPTADLLRLPNCGKVTVMLIKEWLHKNASVSGESTRHPVLLAHASIDEIFGELRRRLR